MTPNHKGAIGEIAATKEIMRQGHDVFMAVGHASRVDLMVLDTGGRARRVQVKYTTSSNERAALHLRKACLDPRYNYSYSREDADVYALYVEDKDIVLFVSSSEIFAEKEKLSWMSFRFAPSKNNQTKGCRMASDYLTFPTDA